VRSRLGDRGSDPRPLNLLTTKKFRLKAAWHPAVMGSLSIAYP
jgi:hypothetical protein